MHFTNIIQHTNSSIVFDIAEVDVSVVNAIRRTILTNVPSVGFYFKLKDHFVENDINIEKNESPLHNEFLSHRFSLIPLHFSKDEIDEWDSKMYTFVIDKTNKTSDLMNITTQDFEILDKDGTVLPKKFRDRIFPADIITKDHILITKFPTNLDNIEKGHQLKLNAFAQKGIAKDCICWSMVSQSSYFNTLDEKAINSFLKEMKKNKSLEEQKEIEEEFDTLEKYRYFKKNEFGDPNHFTFMLESECALSSQYIFFKACQIIASMLEKLIVEFSKEEDSLLIDITSITEVPDFYSISIKEHTHTIGNLIQSIMLNEYIRNKPSKEIDLVYVGYSVPHPLEELFILKLKFNNEMTKRTLTNFLIESITDIKQTFIDLSVEWSTFNNNNL